MLRKSLIAVALLPLSSWSAGFYVGAGLGPDYGDFKQNARITSQSFDARDKTHLAGKGIFGTLFGGYAWNRDYWYLAGEVNGNISSLKFKSSNYEYVNSNFVNTNYKIRSNYGFSLLPGFQYSDTFLFYARAGYVNGNFKTSTQDVSLANVNRHLDGFRCGLGIKQDITEHLSFRMEYSHLNYQKTRFSAFDNSVSKYTIIDPSTNQVEFGIVYTFADKAVMITK